MSGSLPAEGRSQPPIFAGEEASPSHFLPNNVGAVGDCAGNAQWHVWSIVA